MESKAIKRSVLLPLGLLVLPMALYDGSHTAHSGEGKREPHGPQKLRYVEVSHTHLPLSDLQKFSMDAAPVDVDDDGDPDLVIANEFRPNILLLNTGEGRFENVSSERLPQEAHDSEDIGVGDLDADGDLDVVSVSEDDLVNELYLNEGDGSFVDGSSRLPATGKSNAVLVSDIDTDGDLDILIGNNGQNVILVNDGRVSFVDESSARLPQIQDVTQDIELGDVDSDGDPDLLVGNEDGNRLLLNLGDGFFEDATDLRLPSREAPEETREADFGDVDGDGDLDIFFANTKLFVEEASPQNRLLMNDGRGFFVDETVRRLPKDDDLTMDGDFIDVDGDGKLDIITANFDDITGRRADAPYRVYLNSGRGFFLEGTDMVLPEGVTGNGMDIEGADFNGDGRMDLYLSSRGGPDRLLFSKIPSPQ